MTALVEILRFLGALTIAWWLLGLRIWRVPA